MSGTCAPAGLLLPLLLALCLLGGCVEQQPRTLIVTDYVQVPAKQVTVPNFAELQQAAEQGDAPAQYELGRLYADGLGVSKNHRTAMEWWEKSALRGYAPAQYGLGWMYFNGQGVITDFAKGCAWMRAAAEQGIPEAVGYHNEFCVR